MKDIITLEINSKKDVLCNIDVRTPSEFLLIKENTESIINNRIFEEFIDGMFMLVTEEVQPNFKEKIDNVYITFINRNDEFICSIVLNKLNKKKGTYRIGVTDWQASGYIFKYADTVTEEGTDE